MGTIHVPGAGGAGALRPAIRPRLGVDGVKFRIKTWHRILFLFVWTLLVLYPNPVRLVSSVVRVLDPPTDPLAVATMLDHVPSDPAELESYVLRTYPYQYDWLTYGVPWYFPTLEEAMEKGTGDCKTRFVVLASYFEALDIPYTQTFSLSHFWLIYEGKEETPMETASNAWLVRDEEGTRLQVPREDRSQIWRVFREAFWDSMPAVRKGLLLAGLPLSLLLGIPLALLAPARAPIPARVRRPVG